MPKVRRSKKPPPDGWELIEPTLEELEQKMREGNDKKKIEVMELEVMLIAKCFHLSFEIILIVNCV